MFGWFKKKVEKCEFDEHKSAVQTALSHVKEDVGSLSKWVKHLDSKDSDLKMEVKEVFEEIATIKSELEELKEIISEQKNVKNEPLFKQRQTAMHKQTAVQAVQTAVQTAVQAAFFTKLSISEKGIIGILVSSDMKLSYEDLAAMMMKDTATVRGQVNSIRQKCNGLIEEIVEKNGKKRLFIPDKMKEILLKRVKVRPKRENSA